MTAAEDREALISALLAARYWSGKWMPERDGVTGFAAALLPVVDKIARRRAAAVLRTAAVEEAITGTWPLRVYSNDLIARAEALAHHEEAL